MHLASRSRRSITPLSFDERRRASRPQAGVMLVNRRRHGCALLGPSRILLDPQIEKEHTEIDLEK